MMKARSLSELEQKELQAVTREILSRDYMSVEVTDFLQGHRIDYPDGEKVVTTTLSYTLRVGDAKWEKVKNVSTGGPVDALFQGIKDLVISEYASLGTISFVDFVYAAQLDGERGTHQGTDASGEVQLTIENSCGRTFEFIDSSRSFMASAVEAVAQAIEHFINAERAVMRVMDWLEDAQRRNRPELVQTYTDKLSQLVRITSYTEALDERRRRLTGS